MTEIKLEKKFKNKNLRNQEAIQLVEKIEKILASSQGPYEKKITLFNVIKELEVGEINKTERIN